MKEESESTFIDQSLSRIKNMITQKVTDMGSTFYYIIQFANIYLEMNEIRVPPYFISKHYYYNVVNKNP